MAARGHHDQQRLTFRPLVLTPQLFEWYWARLVDMGRWTMNDDVKGREDFWTSLRAVDALHFEAFAESSVMPVGYACLAGIIPGWQAIAHLTFFDKRLRGRERAVRSLLKTLMQELDLQIVHSYTPTTHRASLAWIQRLGFEHEGVIRKQLRRNGVLLDNSVWCITREQIEGAWTDGKPVRHEQHEPETKLHHADFTPGTDRADGGHALPDAVDGAGSTVLAGFRRLWLAWTPPTANGDESPRSVAD